VNNFSIQALIDATLQEMRGMGVPANRIQVLHRTGFSRILRHFEQNGITEYVPSEATSLVYSLREQYERGEISRTLWGLVRRAAVHLESFYNAGALDLSPLPRWSALHNPIHIAPTQEQLDEEGNAHVLIWKIRQELLNFNLTPKTLHNYCFDAFGRILRAHLSNGVTKYSKALTESLVNELRTRMQQGNLSGSVFSIARKAAALLDEYHKTGTLEWRKQENWNKREPVEEFAQALEQFCVEMTRIDRYSAATMKSTKSTVRRFLFTLEDSGVNSFNRVTLKAVSDCVTTFSQGFQGGVNFMLFSVRIFLQYLYENDTIQVDLRKGIPEAAPLKRTVHEGFTVEEIHKLLGAPRKDTSVGIRDYAMMLLAAQTGLRSVDIANLKRGDVDWRCNEIRIVQHKTGKAISLPLAPETGNAIANYVLHHRPDSNLPFVFLCEYGPCRPLNPASVSANVTKYMRRAGIDTTNVQRGSHSFRRSFGTRLLEAEVPIDTLLQLLGHSQANSARPYLSASEKGLKSCALSLTLTGKAGVQ